MTTYYVGPSGSDGAAGTSYGTRWLTIGKALGASGIASGDTVYVTPGTYRETVAVAMTSATVTTNVIGDVDGSHTSGVPGDVILTGYTTNDTTAPTALNVLSLAGRDFLSFSNFIIINGATNSAIGSTTAVATDITFTDCTIISTGSGASVVNVTGTTLGVALNWLFNRCRLFSKGGGSLVNFTLARGTGADYDAKFTLRNCLLMVLGGSAAINMASSGAGVNVGGGGLVENCTILASTCVNASVSTLSTTIPCVVQNSLLVGATGLNATTSGQITESHNLFACTTARANVTAGTGSISDFSYAVNFEFGQEIANGRQGKPFMTPMAGSPLLGFGAASSPPTVDASNRPRPAGGQITNAVGYLERHNTATKETGTTDAGSVAITITGPGDHDFQIPVDAGSTTVTVKVNYDTNHGTANPPQAKLLANAEIGYAGETVTATTTTGSWLTLSFAAFTPSAKSIVTLRLISRSAASNGVAHFDTVTVT